MILARLILVLSGLLFLALGAAFLGWPREMAAIVHLEPATPLAMTEVRAMYGGLEVGLGAFLVAGALRSASLAPALAVLFAASTGLGCGRALGMLVDGAVEAKTLAFFALEAALAAAAAVGWLRVQRGAR